MYDPKSGSNEEDSAVVFRRFSDAVELNPSAASTVSDYIIATKRHNVNESDDPDLRAFIDLDMAVVGRESSAYLAYASQVRTYETAVDYASLNKRQVPISSVPGIAFGTYVALLHTNEGGEISAICNLQN